MATPMSRENRVLFKRMKAQLREHLYKSIEFLAVRGMHAKTIAKYTGTTPWQVYTACKQMQIRLRDYRDGLGPIGKPTAEQGRRIAKGKREV